MVEMVGSSGVVTPTHLEYRISVFLTYLYDGEVVFISEKQTDDGSSITNVILHHLKRRGEVSNSSHHIVYCH